VVVHGPDLSTAQPVGRAPIGTAQPIVTARRDVDKFEFTPPAFDRVTGYLHHLTEAGQGWINLLPGVDPDEEEQQTPPGLFSLFSGRQAPVTMCTFVPPRPNRRDIEGVTVGVLHPTGSKAVARLAEAGVPVPERWTVRQDHARRGVVLLALHGTPANDIITWALRAGTALCRTEMTGQWQAVVYLP
jgi:hypothetical protein